MPALADLSAGHASLQGALAVYLSAGHYQWAELLGVWEAMKPNAGHMVSVAFN